MHVSMSNMEKKRKRSDLIDKSDWKLLKKPKIQLERLQVEDLDHSDSSVTDEDETKIKNFQPPNKEQKKNKATCSYEEWRLKNVEENTKFLVELGIHKVKEDIFSSSTKKKKPVNKTIKKEELPRRSSLRLRRISPDGTSLPELPLKEEITENEHERKPPGPLVLLDCLYNVNKEDAVARVADLQKIMESKVEALVSTKQPDIESYVKTLNKIKLRESGVSKVVPSRIFSVAVHPNVERVLAACGDKWGRLGLWHVSNLPADGICTFEPHERPISNLEFNINNSGRLLSSSYDGTIRCLDITKNIFDEVYATPEEDDIRLSGFSFFSSETLVTAQSDGKVGFIDFRTPGSGAEHLYKTHEKSIKCVSVHPIQRHYFATSARDCLVSIWDSRKMTKRPITSLKHDKSIDSVYFSPKTGNLLLSTSIDDWIRIFDTSSITDNIQMQTRIKHNNYTGRWLSNFKAIWHPRREDLFIVGSMSRPRQIEMYSSTGKLVKCFQDVDNLNSVCSLNAFHPNRDVLVGGNSSGRMFVFM